MGVLLEDANTQGAIINGEFSIEVSPVLATYIAPINFEVHST